MNFEIIEQLQELKDDENYSTNLNILNNNQKTIYQLLKETYNQTKQINEQIKEKLIPKESENKEISLTELDPTIRIKSQTQEYIYSKVIPGLKLGKIIKQDFEYVRED